MTFDDSNFFIRMPVNWHFNASEVLQTIHSLEGFAQFSVPLS
jgi:hypothetical protein